MKIDDVSLNRYLIKNLKPLTEADPSLLANYVAALLKNNKSKKELQKLCVDQLYDFLGDGTKAFVTKLFQSIEDGSVPSETEEMETNKGMEIASGIASGTELVDLRSSPPHLERIPSTAVRSFSGEGDDESSDDEDDDRNHKHRRRVSRSRSFDRDGEDDTERGLYRKRGRASDNGQLLRDIERPGNERRGPMHVLHTEREGPLKFDRRIGRDHGSGRFNVDGGQRGVVRSGPQFRDGVGPRFDGPNGLLRSNMGRGRGIGGVWTPHDQRFPPPPFSEGAEFAPPLLAPGQVGGFFSGRGMPVRSTPHSPWAGYGPLSGMGNGPLEHPLPGGMQGGRGPPPLPSGMGRPRCLDFEERGYCLRGDLCPMEHGANRIVVEDVQSLSKFNLPVSLPSGRGLGIGPVSGPSSSPMLAPAIVNRNNHGSREASLSGDDPSQVNGVTAGSGGVEPDLYDPDQPLWNKARPEASSGLRKLPSSFQKGTPDLEWDNDSVEKQERREGSDGTEVGRQVRLGGNTNGGSQGTESGPSVWDRIGPVVSVVPSRPDGGLRTGPLVDLPHNGKPLRKDGGDDVPTHVRSVWQGKWNRDADADEESVPSTTPSVHTRGRGSARGDGGAAGQRSADGASQGLRGAGGRGSSGHGSERAQRTLYVSFIPPNSNKTEQLLAHFQKFGDVLDIRIPVHSDRAFVQFSRREDAEAALTAPDAVMSNRFIRLSWANRDSIPDPAENVTLTPGNRIGKLSTGISSGPVVQASKVPEKVVVNGSGSRELDVGTFEMAGKLPANGGSSAAVPAGAATVKKQEELERMREEIRKKQEALAQKRDDFRRKLDQLAKQGPAQAEALDSDQPSKRQKLDDAEESASGSRKTILSQASLNSTAASTPVELAPSPAALVKTSSGDAVRQTAASVLVQPGHPSPRIGRSPHGRINNANLSYTSPLTWGPARFKLDNRTTVFRIIPPFPATLIDVGTLKEHFVMYGELATVDIEDAEGIKMDGSTKLSEASSVRVSFATRRAAERAFAQGRWLQGQNLHFVWVNSAGTPTGGGVTAAVRADLTEEKLFQAVPVFPSGSPTVEQEGVNGSGSLEQEITEQAPEAQVQTADENLPIEEVVVAGHTDEKIPSSAVRTEWRRDAGQQVHTRSQSLNSVNSGPTN